MPDTDQQVADAYVRQEIRRMRGEQRRNGIVMMLASAGLSMQAASGDRHFAEWVVGAVFAFVFSLFFFGAANSLTDPKNQANVSQFITDRATVRAARRRAKEAARD